MMRALILPMSMPMGDPSTTRRTASIAVQMLIAAGKLPLDTVRDVETST